jgi:hypothetical protein
MDNRQPEGRNPVSLTESMEHKGWTTKTDQQWERVENDRMCIALIRPDDRMTIMVQGRDGWAGVGYIPAGLPAKTTARRATEMALR